MPWLILLAVAICAAFLVVVGIVLPLVALGGLLGGTAGMIGFARARPRAQARWLTVTALAGAVGAMLASYYWDQSIARSSDPLGETLLLAGFIGSQIALMCGVLVTALPALVGERSPRWLARLVH